MNRKKIFALTAFVMVFAMLCGSSDSAANTGCRDLADRIRYSHSISPPSQVATILRAGVRDRSTVLTVAFGDDRLVYESLEGTWEWRYLRDFVADVVISSQSEIMYRYRSAGIIERSVDGGRSWATSTPLVGGVSAKDIAFQVSGDHSYGLEFDIAAIHPSKPLTVYATVRAAPPRSPEGNPGKRYALPGMYVSEDGGEHWKSFSNDIGIFDNYPRKVLLGINPADTDVMFSEGRHRILRSTNAGLTWMPVGQSDFLNAAPLDSGDKVGRITSSRKQVPLNVQQFVFDLSSTRIVYMVTKKGVYRSLDNGDTWSLLNLGFDRLNAINSFAVDPLGPSRVFAGTDQGLFVSEDRGCKFVKVPPVNSQ